MQGMERMEEKEVVSIAMLKLHFEDFKKIADLSSAQGENRKKGLKQALCRLADSAKNISMFQGDALVSMAASWKHDWLDNYSSLITQSIFKPLMDVILSDATEESM